MIKQISFMLLLSAHIANAIPISEKILKDKGIVTDAQTANTILNDPHSQRIITIIKESQSSANVAIKALEPKNILKAFEEDSTKTPKEIMNRAVVIKGYDARLTTLGLANNKANLEAIDLIMKPRADGGFAGGYLPHKNHIETVVQLNDVQVFKDATVDEKHTIFTMIFDSAPDEALWRKRIEVMKNLLSTTGIPHDQATFDAAVTAAP